MRASRFIALLTLTLSLVAVPTQAIASSEVEYRQLFQQGIAATAAHNFAQAESIWQRLIRQYGDLVDQDTRALLYNNLGVVLENQARWEEATVAYQRSLALHPNSLGYNNLGTTLIHAGRIDEAIDAFLQSLSCHNEDGLGTSAHALAHFNLGNIFYQQGNLESALAEYRQVLALDPDFKEAENQIYQIQEALNSQPIS